MPGVEPQLPIPVVVCNGEDITNLIDLDTMHRTASDHGEGTLEFDMPVLDLNDIASNNVTQNAQISVYIEGVLEWYGYVVNVQPVKADDLTIAVTCAGSWEQLSRRNDFCKGFLECRTELFQQMDPTLLPAVVTGAQMTNMAAATIDTSGQVLITIPAGSSVKAGQGVFLCLYVLDGMDANSAITAMVVDYSLSSGAFSNYYWDVVVMKSPWSPTFVGGPTFSTPSGRITWTGGLAGTCCLGVYLQSAQTVASTSVDDFFQLRNLKVYIDGSTAPTVDTAVAGIVGEVLPSAVTNATTATIGSPLSQLMIDPHTTAADAITSDILTRSNYPPQCGISQGNLVCIPRPTAPTDSTRLWQVSDALTPGLDWDVSMDNEQRVDCVAADYNILGVNGCAYPENDDLTSWPNFAGGWDYVSATNTVIYNSGSVYQFSVVSNSTNENPSTTYPQGGYFAVTSGLEYRLSCLAYITNYSTGRARVGIQWFDSGYNLLSTSLAVDIAAAQPNEAAYSAVAAAPATAAYGKLVMYWYSVSTVGPYALRVRHIDFRPAMPDGALQKLYYPAAPAAFNSRVGLLDVGDATTADALTAAQQAYYWWHNVSTGSITVPYMIHNANGQKTSVEHVRQWDWIQNVGLLDPTTAGPFMVTDVDLQGGVAVIGVGNTDAFNYTGSPRVPVQGKYIPAHKVKVKYRKRESFSTWWRKTHKKEHYRLKSGKMSKDTRYPAMPKKHPAYKYVWATKYKTVAGSYGPGAYDVGN